MSIRDRLRLVFHREPTPPSSDEPAPFQAAPEIEFIAYAEDCRLFGHTRLDADRLTDMLNAHAEVELIDVAMEALVDGRVVEVRSMVVARDDLLVVQAAGPRGAKERRQRTRPHPVAVQSGPYLVRGQLHALPTADPFVALRRRPPMVPLTEGSIAYTVGDQSVIRRTDTIIINRTAMDWIVPATDDEVRFPDLPAKSGILVKDFTGLIYELSGASATPATDADADPAAEPAAAAGAAPAEPAVVIDEAPAQPTKGATARRSRRAGSTLGTAEVPPHEPRRRTRRGPPPEAIRKAG
jgi:hypothetical protein